MTIILSADDFGRSHTRNLAVDYAMRNNLICSAALMINSNYTQEAIQLAKQGGYLEHIHLHLNLAYGEEMSGSSKPLSQEFSDCSVFCEDGDFKHPFYNGLDFYKYCSVTYKELEAQYLQFKKLTDEQANNYHLDVHLYNNRSFPFASAYYELIREYQIETARYFGEHHFHLSQSEFESYRIKLASLLCGEDAKVCKSCNVDYFLTRKSDFSDDSIVELYVHPDYVDNTLLDNTISCFGHEKRPLIDQINALKSDAVEFISWAKVKRKTE